jgi:hypothetical protein
MKKIVISLTALAGIMFYGAEAYGSPTTPDATQLSAGEDAGKTAGAQLSEDTGKAAATEPSAADDPGRTATAQLNAADDAGKATTTQPSAADDAEKAAEIGKAILETAGDGQTP